MTKVAMALVVAATVPMAAPADAAPNPNSCYATTRFSFTASCTMIPTTPWLTFSCTSYFGATGRVTLVQHVFANTQECSWSQRVNVVPGVPVGLTLTQTNTTGFLEGTAFSTIG